MMPAKTATRIRKRIDQNDPLRRLDLAINKLAPHFAAVGGSEAVMKDAARTKIQVSHRHGEAFWPKPLHQAITFGPGLPHEISWRIERARGDEFLIGGFLSWIVFCGHASFPSFDFFLSIAVGS